MLIRIKRAGLRSSLLRPAPSALKPYEPYKPYQPYKPHSPSQAGRYQPYAGYKPYGHAEHSLSPKQVLGGEPAQGDTLKSVLASLKQSLPPFVFVGATPDEVTIDVDPYDIGDFADGIESSGISVECTLDEDELPIHCKWCGKDYTTDEKNGRCPRCIIKSCSICRQKYNVRKSRCPRCYPAT